MVHVELHTIDYIVLGIIFLMMIGCCRLIYGFFHEGPKKLVNSNTYNGKGPVKLTLTVDGMMCGQCEAHVNDAIRKNFEVEKVTSSHTKGKTVIIAPKDIRDSAIKAAVSETGYEVMAVQHENYRGKLSAA